MNTQKFGMKISFGKDTGEAYFPVTQNVLGKYEDGIDGLAERSEQLIRDSSELPGLLDIALVGDPMFLRIKYDKNQTDLMAVVSWATRKGLAVETDPS